MIAKNPSSKILSANKKSLMLDAAFSSINSCYIAYDVSNFNKPHHIFHTKSALGFFDCKNQTALTKKLTNLRQLIFKNDYPRVYRAFCKFLVQEKTINISFRLNQCSLPPTWVRLEGNLEGNLLNLIFTSLSEDTKAFQEAGVDAQGLYVISQKTHELLYYNESVDIFAHGKHNFLGQKCFHVLHNQKNPCSFCPLQDENTNRLQTFVSAQQRTYGISKRTFSWYDIPAYILSVNDITKELTDTAKNKQLDKFYNTLVANIPCGIAVVRVTKEREYIPEFISEVFAQMCGMTLKEAYELYDNDARAGMHPDDVESTMALIDEQFKTTKSGELIYRLQHKKGGYIWVKNTSSLIPDVDESFILYSIYNDITKEVVAKENLQKKYNGVIFNKNRFSLEGEFLSGYCNVTQNKIVQIYDKTGCDILKHFGTVRECFFKRFADLMVSEADRNYFCANFLNEPLKKKFASGQFLSEMECTLKLPDGSPKRYVKVSVNTIEVPDTGDIVGILSVIDLTNEKLNRELSTRLSHIYYDFITLVDFKTDHYSLFFQNANMALEKEGTYSEWVSKLLNDYVVPKDYHRCAQKMDPIYIEHRLAEEDFFTFHYSIKSSTGKVHFKNMIIYVVDKELKKYGFACSDITDSTHEQIALLNTLAYTFEQINIINLPGDELITYTRQTLLDNLLPNKYIGIQRNINKLTKEYVSLSSQESAKNYFSLKYMQKHLQENPNGYDFVVAKNATGKKTVYKQISVLWGDENHNSICLVHLDITDVINEEKDSKNELLTTLKIAQQASKAKSNFLSSMSHDIRTPMNAIMGMADLALDEIDPSQSLAKYLQIIKNSSTHLLTLINDILDMSRIESGATSTAKQPFNLSQEADKFTSNMRVLIDQKDLKFNYKISVEHPDVSGDVLHLHRIWGNVLGNAIKFTPPGGKVSFKIKELEPKSPHLGLYEFTISDNGIGIPEDDLPHLFEPFYRMHNTLKTDIEGSGLGLAIVKNILDFDSGTVAVKSTVGKGSTFTIILPLVFSTEKATLNAPYKTPTAPTAHLGDAFDFTGKQILLVEDHPLNQNVAELILQKTGAKVTIAENGLVATELFKNSASGTFQAILMDIQMPIMNGYEATEAIRKSKHPEAKTIPIIAMTANAFSADIKSSFDAGMNAHIAKPIEPQKLYETLEKHFK